MADVRPHLRRGPVLGFYVLTSFHSVYESPLRFTTDHRGPFSLRDSTDRGSGEGKRENGGNEKTMIAGPGGRGTERPP